MGRTKGSRLTEEHRRRIAESRRTSPRARAAYQMLRVLRRGQRLPAGAERRSAVARWMRKRGLEPHNAPELFEAYVQLREEKVV